jgi:hypothetical protein
MVFLLASGPARADIRVVSDGNDVSGPLDIRRATHGHSGAAFVTHTVSTFAPFSSSFLRGRNGITFQFDINNSARTFERFIIVGWVNGSLRALVANRTRIIGRAGVSRPNARTVRIRVRKSLINPNHYQWLVATFFGASGFDVAPNGSVRMHDLVGPTITQLKFPNPSTNGSASIVFPVSFRLNDTTGVRSWILQRRLAGASVWETISQGSGTGVKSRQIEGEQGLTYEFRVRATDRVGLTTTSATRQVTVPWDDGNAVFASAYAGTWFLSGFSTYFLGGAHALDATGTFTHVFNGTSVTLISGGLDGTATVTIDAEPPVVVTLNSAQFRRKVFERTGLAPGPHTIVIAQQSGFFPIDAFVFR